MLRFSKFQKLVLHFLVFIGFFLPEVFALVSLLEVELDDVLVVALRGNYHL